MVQQRAEPWLAENLSGGALLLGLPSKHTKGRIHTQIAFHKSLIAFQSPALILFLVPRVLYTFGKSLSLKVYLRPSLTI
jgi:hypothetical protein